MALRTRAAPCSSALTHARTYSALTRTRAASRSHARVSVSPTAPGTLYQHAKTPGLNLCESEWRKLPPEGNDEELAALLQMYTGEVFAQSDFTRVPAIDRAAIESRLGLAQAAMDAICARDPEWFNEDENYEVAIGVPLRAGLQLSRPMLPPVVRVVGDAAPLGGVEEGIVASDAVSLAALQALQAVELDEHGQGLLRSKVLTAVDRGHDASDTQLLRLFADPSTVYLVGRRERRGLPEGIALLEKTERVDFSSCKRLTNLPFSMCRCRCPGQQDTQVAGFEGQCGCMCSNLQVIDLRACHSLTALPSNLGQLRSLRLLDLGDCWSLSELPDSLGLLSSLQDLKL